MAKTTQAAPGHDEQQSGFPIPLQFETFKTDALAVFLHHLRVASWVSGPARAWMLTGATPLAREYDLMNPERTAADLGLRWEQIHETDFGQYMEHLYEYAYLGRRDMNKEALTNESVHTWLAALLCDTARSEVASEYALNGVHISEPASRCVLVAETANARVTLEGGEPFFERFQGGKEGYLEEGLLTVRQLALLSGMEEMSIRAAANPKRATPLPTVSTDQGTRIEIAAAKDWLRAKGRYVAISHYWHEGEIDLTKRKFDGPDDLAWALNSRYQMLCNQVGRTTIDASLKHAGVATSEGYAGPNMDLEDFDFGDEFKVASLADVLNLPAELLMLRCKEAVAHETLRHVERALRELSKAQ
tara:strand:+ start:10338 stop:11417 length:1080 start_codon:yes stop_codon:yes gene_type:complete